jgi:ubiquinone biosynthesis protein
MLDRRYVPTLLRSESETATVGIHAVSALSPFPSLQVLWQSFIWLVSLFWYWIRGQLTPSECGRLLRMRLEKIGGLWIKVGQLVSLRRDLFPNEFCSEMAKLQDSVAGFPSEVAKAILAESLGAPVGDYFECFVDEPLAAASIGQIHKARLRHEHRWVVVKIQRPNIRERFQRDLQLIKLMVRIVDRLKLLMFLHLSEMVMELEPIAAEELDYRIEAANISRMRRTLRHHNIYVPQVFRRFTSKQVLVMEFVEGILMSEFIEVQLTSPDLVRTWLQGNDICTDKVATQLFQSTLRQLFEDNLFHGDLHPGNIMLLRHSRLALIDFGSVGSMEVEYQNKYKLFVESLVNGEYSRAVDFLFLVCNRLPQVDTNEVKKRIIRSIKAWEVRTYVKELSYHEKSLATLMDDVVKILMEYRIWTDWAFMRIDRVTLSLDASLATLAPAANYPAMIRAYFRDLYYRELKKNDEDDNVVETLARMESAGFALARAAAEYPVLQEPVIRSSARMFAGDSSKATCVLLAISRFMFWSTTLAEAFLLLCFILQYNRSFFVWLSPLLGSAILDFANRFPALGYVSWLAIILLVGAFARVCARTTTRLKQPDLNVEYKNKNL